jgi:hypothetical protein
MTHSYVVLAHSPYFEKIKEACCLCICVFPLKLIGNGTVNMVPRQPIHTQKCNCWPHFFYAVRITHCSSKTTKQV